MQTRFQLRSSYYAQSRRNLRSVWPNTLKHGVDATIEEAVLLSLGAVPTPYWEDPHDGDMPVGLLPHELAPSFPETDCDATTGLIRVEVKSARDVRRKQFELDPGAFDVLVLAEWWPLPAAIGYRALMLPARALGGPTAGRAKRRIAEELKTALVLPNCAPIIV